MLCILASTGHSCCVDGGEMATAREKKKTKTEFQNFNRGFVKYAATNVVFLGTQGRLTIIFHNGVPG